MKLENETIHVTYAVKVGMKALVFLLILLQTSWFFGLGKANPVRAGLDKKVTSNIRQILQKAVEAKTIPGGHWTVIRKGRTGMNYRFGYADVESSEPIHSKSLYRLFNLSEPLVAMLAMKQVEQGKLQLSRPVASYLPIFQGLQVANDFVLSSGNSNPLVGLRVHHLLTHTDGFTHSRMQDPLAQIYQRQGITAGYPFATSGQVLFNWEDTLASLARLPLLHQPGQATNPGLGYAILGLILEQITGKSAQVLLEQQLLKPLKLSTTYGQVPLSERKRMTSLYVQRPLQRLTKLEQGNQSLWLQPPKMFAMGNHLVSSMDDMVKVGTWLLNQQSDGYLSESSYRYLTKSHGSFITNSSQDPMAVAMVTDPMHRPMAVAYGGQVVTQNNSFWPMSTGSYIVRGDQGAMMLIDFEQEMLAIFLTQVISEPIINTQINDLQERLIFSLYQSLRD